MGEKAVCAGFENGVETGGVAAASCEGVRPCCEAPCFIGVGVDIEAVRGPLARRSMQASGKLAQAEGRGDSGATEPPQ